MLLIFKICKLYYTASPIKVLPVPGGPNNRIPFGGRRNPVKISGLSKGHTTISWNVERDKSIKEGIYSYYNHISKKVNYKN